MYSGTTLTRYSGRVMGAHQKINRVARRHLKHVSDGAHGFPSIKSILHFEGKNGPDAIKRKSPARDEPWHWYDPFDEDDSQLLDQIELHYKSLIHELQSGNKEHAAFEAAWLAHAVVDGLTPAHHYPFEERLQELRGEGIETRDTILRKNIIPGDGAVNTVVNNWKYWGPKGLFSTHGFFELGVAMIMAPLRLANARPTPHEIHHLHEIGPIEWFKHTARRIAVLDMYERFYEKGWTPKLAQSVREELAPEITRSVCLIWYGALREAQLLHAPAKV